MLLCLVLLSLGYASGKRAHGVESVVDEDETDLLALQYTSPADDWRWQPRSVEHLWFGACTWRRNDICHTGHYGDQSTTRNNREGREEAREKGAGVAWRRVR